MASHRILQDINDAIIQDPLPDPGNGQAINLRGHTLAAVQVTPTAADETRLLPSQANHSDVRPGTRVSIVNCSDTHAFELYEGETLLVEVGLGTVADCIFGEPDGVPGWTTRLYYREQPVGDEEPDNRTLQERIDDGYTTGKVVLPQGEIDITETVNCDDKISLVVEGQGGTARVNPAHVDAGGRTQIRWATSNTSTPMFLLDGSRNHVFRDIGVHGDTYNSAYGGEPTACFHVYGSGSGKHQWYNCTTDKGDSGFKFGVDVNSSNSDTSKWYGHTFRNHNKGLNVVNSQGMSYAFYGGDWTSSNTDSSVWHFDAGGDLAVYKFDILSRCNVLTLNQLGTAIGPNNGIFRIHDIKVDTTSRGTRLLNCPAAAGDGQINARVIFDGCKVSGNGWGYIVAGVNGAAGYPMSILRGERLHVTFLNCEFAINVADSLEWHTTGQTNATIVEFIGCRLTGITAAEDILYHANSDGDIGLIMQRCFSNINNRITDFEDLAIPA